MRDVWLLVEESSICSLLAPSPLCWVWLPNLCPDSNKCSSPGEQNYALKRTIAWDVMSLYTARPYTMPLGLASPIMQDLILDQTKFIMHIFSHKCARSNPSSRLLEKKCIMQQISLNVNQCERVNKRHSYLSCIPSVNELHTFLSSETVDIQFIRVSAPMPFLFGSPLMKLHSLKHTKKHFEACGSLNTIRMTHVSWPRNLALHEVKTLIL